MSDDFNDVNDPWGNNFRKLEFYLSLWFSLLPQGNITAHCQVPCTCLNFPLKKVKEREGESLALL